MPEDSTTGNLTVLVQKIENLASITQSNHLEIKEMLKDHEARIRLLEKGHAEITARQTMLTLIQGAFTAIAATVATALGRN